MKLYEVNVNYLESTEDGTLYCTKRFTLVTNMGKSSLDMAIDEYIDQEGIEVSEDRFVNYMKNKEALVLTKTQAIKYGILIQD